MWSNYVIIVERTCTSESMNPRPCFNALQYYLCSLFIISYLAVFIFSDYKNHYLLSILHLYHDLFAELVHYTIYYCIGCVGDTRDSLLFGCRVACERPSSSYASHGLINLRSST